jgi:HEAT repeat protein
MEEKIVTSLVEAIKAWLASNAPRDDWSEYWDGIDKLKHKEDSLAIGLAQTESTEVARRIVGVNLLGQLCNPVEEEHRENARTIIKRLSVMTTEESDEACLEAIADALGFPYMEDVREALLLLSKSDFEGVRLNAAQGLGSILESEGVLDRVKELCDDDDGEVRNWSIFHLVADAETRVDMNEKLKESYPDIFAAHVDDGNIDARCEALEGLALYKDERGINPLLRDLKEDTVTKQNIKSAGIYENSIFLEPLLAIEKEFGGDDELTDAIRKSR